MNIDIFFFVLVILGLISIHVYCFLRERSTLYITVFLDIVVGGLSILAITNHPLFKDWMQEDAWVEWATFYVFIGAGLLFFFCLLRGRNDPNKRNPLVLIGTLILSVFCFLVAAEEISWGQRLFAFKPPNLFLEMNFQQELNIHNIFKKKELAGVPLDSRYLVAFTAIFYGIILAVMPHIFKRGRLAEAISVVAPPIFLAPWFVIVAYVEITYPVKLAGEAAEFVLGLLFLIVAFTLYRSSESSQKNMIRFRNFKVIVVVMIPIILGLITPSILQATLFSKKTGNIVQTQIELEELHQDFLQDRVIAKRMKNKRMIHKRLYTSVQKGYINPPTPSVFLRSHVTTTQQTRVLALNKDRRSYFLDPWNNPYWIHYSKKKKEITIYSFGPNRRRDLINLEHNVSGSEIQGDDISITIKISS